MPKRGQRAPVTVARTLRPAPRMGPYVDLEDAVELVGLVGEEAAVGREGGVLAPGRAWPTSVREIARRLARRARRRGAARSQPVAGTPLLEDEQCGRPATTRWGTRGAASRGGRSASPAPSRRQVEQLPAALALRAPTVMPRPSGVQVGRRGRSPKVSCESVPLGRSTIQRSDSAARADHDRHAAAVGAEPRLAEGARRVADACRAGPSASIQAKVVLGRGRARPACRRACRRRRPRSGCRRSRIVADALQHDLGRAPRLAGATRSKGTASSRPPRTKTRRPLGTYRAVGAALEDAPPLAGRRARRRRCAPRRRSRPRRPR